MGHPQFPFFHSPFTPPPSRPIDHFYYSNPRDGPKKKEIRIYILGVTKALKMSLISFLLFLFLSRKNYFTFLNILFPVKPLNRLFLMECDYYMAFRIISNPSDITPTFACDAVEDLKLILKDKHYNEQGTAAIVISTGEVYMLNGNREWVKL